MKFECGKVGTVFSVSGNTITIHLSDLVKSNSIIIDGVVYKIGQVGSFLKIPLGYCNLYGIVTQIGASAMPSNLLENLSAETIFEMANRQWVTISLVGEEIGAKFQRGISQSPTIGDDVFLVTINDLKNIYSEGNSLSSINIGNISFSESLDAYLDLNKLISRHCALLGSTGSGKSNAVSVIIKGILEKKFKSTRIVIIDPHGEYNNTFKAESVVFKTGFVKNREHHLYVPFWALPYNELMSIFGESFGSSKLNDDFFQSKITDYKIIGCKENNLQLMESTITSSSPVPFNIKELRFELDDFERQTYNERGKPESLTGLVVKGNANELKSNIYQPASNNNSKPFLNNNARGILNFLERIRLKLMDKRYQFLFEPGDYSPDSKGKVKKDLGCLLKEWLGNDKPISIFDLSDVPSELMVSVSGSLLKIIYDALFRGQNLYIGGKKQPLLIVLEEAHNYLNKGSDSIAHRTIKRIAKEGRKYGVGLLLVTQRPAELDDTILSQCGTMIALRMNNSKDRGFVSANIQDELQALVDLLPSLRTGEGIVSGEAAKIPSRVQFYKVSNASKGSDPDVAYLWNLDKHNNEEEYNILVELWRNKKFTKEG